MLVLGSALLPSGGALTTYPLNEAKKFYFLPWGAPALTAPTAYDRPGSPFINADYSLSASAVTLSEKSSHIALSDEPMNSVRCPSPQRVTQKCKTCKLTHSQRSPAAICIACKKIDASSFVAPTTFAAECRLSLTSWLKLPPLAARFVCDSSPTCIFHTNTSLSVPHSYSIQHATDYKIGLRCQSVSVSVRLRALSRSHFLIDFHQNWHRRKHP